MSDGWKPRISTGEHHYVKKGFIGVAVGAVALAGFQGYQHLKDDACAMQVIEGDYQGAIACGAGNAAKGAIDKVKDTIAGALQISTPLTLPPDSSW